MINHDLSFVPAGPRVLIFGAVFGDGTVYLLFATLIVMILVALLIVSQARGGARPGAANRALDGAPPHGRGAAGQPASAGVGPDGQPMHGPDAHDSATYRVVLEQIAIHLLSKAADNIIIGEVEGGYLLLYHDRAGEAVVETVTFAQIAAAGQTPRSGMQPLRQHLAQIGRFLDQQFAISALISRQQGGYYVEYAAPPSGAHSASKLVRVSRMMDNETLSRLAQH
ncbi:MAG: hypothetical protein NVSMB65_11650 [Chloroflexota bacterium]